MLRTVRTDWGADDQVEAARERWQGTDDIWDALVWEIARDPQVGTPLNEAGTVRAYTMQGARSIGEPTVTIIYTIEPAETVTIREANFQEAQAAQAGHA